MAETISHVVNRFVIDSEDTFDDVRQRYESLVPTIDFAELAEVIATGDLARVQQYTAEHAPHSFVNFWVLDPMPMMRLAGNQQRAITYMMGNNVIAETMFRHDPASSCTHRYGPRSTKTPSAARTSASTSHQANSPALAMPA
jgi:hypothetical protein